MPEPLSPQDVRHVANLARLHLNDEQVERYRDQLSNVLLYVTKISELDVRDVEPLAHPIEMTNRLDEDEVPPHVAMPVEHLIMNAPAVEDRFLAVPKVLDDSGGSGNPGGSGG